MRVLLSFQFGCLLFIYFVWMLWLGLPIVCWIKAVKVDILVLFLILMKKLSSWATLLHQCQSPCLALSLMQHFIYGIVFFLFVWDHYIGRSLVIARAVKNCTGSLKQLPVANASLDRWSSSPTSGSDGARGVFCPVVPAFMFYCIWSTF